MQTGTVFHPLGLDRARMLELMAEQGLAFILLTSPENVFYTSGYTALPSSGHPILDQEAVATVRRAEPYPAPPAGLDGETFAFKFPFKFDIH